MLDMKRVTIDWKKVAHLALDKDIKGKRALAKSAGLHYNTLYNNKEFRSTTVDKLAKLFGCSQLDLLSIVDDGEATQ